MDDEFTSDKKHDSEIVSDMLKSIKIGIDAIETWHEEGDSRDVEIELMMFRDVADRLVEPYEQSTGVTANNEEMSGVSCGEAIFGNEADMIVSELESISEFIENSILDDSTTVSEAELDSVIENASDIGNKMNMVVRDN